MSTPCKASCTSLFVSTLQVSSTVIVLRSFLTIILSEYSKTIHFFWRHCTGLRTAAYKFFYKLWIQYFGTAWKVYYVMSMWWLCDEYVCDGYVMSMRWLCDGCDEYEYLMVMWWVWLVCDGYVMSVMGMWWLCDGYVMVMWWVCD